MKSMMFKRMAAAILIASPLALVSCTSKPPAPESTSSTTFEQGVPGGVVVETYTVTANVTDVDAAKRVVTLLLSDGTKTAVKCGPEVINFDQIRVGDQLKVVFTEELAVSMVTGASAQPGEASAVALAPRGAKPGAIVAAARQVTATVTEIDLKQHRATLRFSDGSIRKVAVRPDVDLTKRHVGEQVVIRITESVAILVEKP